MLGWLVFVAVLIAPLGGCELDRSGLGDGPDGPEAGAADAAGQDAARPDAEGIDAGPPFDAGPPPGDDPRIAAGEEHTCAIGRDGSLTCWGKGGNNRLGLGDDRADHGAPQLVGTDSDWLRITASDQHTCGIRLGGRLFCWGNGMHDRLGFPSMDTGTPTEVLAGMRFLEVSAGGDFTCAIASDHQIWCWGRNNEGQLGRAALDGEAEPPAPTMDVGPRFEIIACGHDFVCAIARDGQLWCWGHNGNNQLGLDEGAPGAIGMPTPVAPGSLWIGIAAGRAHACGVQRNGSLHCWGLNDAGQAGTGETGGNTDHPIAILGGERFTGEISAFDSATCAIHSDGSMWCWGENGGALGTGDTVDQLTPTRLMTPTVPGWRRIGTGLNHSCAWDSRSLIHCWGDNGEGQLGMGAGDTMARLVPTPLP